MNVESVLRAFCVDYIDPGWTVRYERDACGYRLSVIKGLGKTALHATTTISDRFVEYHSNYNKAAVFDHLAATLKYLCWFAERPSGVVVGVAGHLRSRIRK